MLNLISLLVPTSDSSLYNLYRGLSITMIILMGISALAAIILVLMQPANSSGIDALGGGSSETFFGKNKGKSSEEKLKKWTWICLAILVVFSIAFFVLQLESIWA